MCVLKIYYSYRRNLHDTTTEDEFRTEQKKRESVSQQSRTDTNLSDILHTYTHTHIQ